VQYSSKLIEKKMEKARPRHGASRQFNIGN
jgi:hypothetical protein